MHRVLIAFVVLLTGCVSLPPSTPPPVVAAPVPCVKYTSAQIRALGSALAAIDIAKLPGRQTIDGFMTDYHNMRVAAGCDQ